MELEQLEKLIQAVSDSELSGFKYEENGIKLSMSKEKTKIVSGEAVTTISASEAVIPKKEPGADVNEEPKQGKLIKSPLVGTFYAAPSEDAEPFVEEGAAVKKGQTIAIVEAMKLMNDIESEFDGTIAEVLVANGEAVEYGQPLFRIV